MRLRPLLLVFLASSPLVLGACAMSSLQSARPTPKGQFDLMVSAGLTGNEYMKGEKFGIAPHTALRYGLTERMDIGLAPFLVTGGLVDVKRNFIDGASRFALSAQVGFGVGSDVFDEGGAVHVPLNVLASYDVGPFTPYLSLGYGTFWFYGQDKEWRDPGVRYAKRTVFGDGALLARIGFELRLYHRTAFLAEFGWVQPLVDDPGDFFDLGRGYSLQAGFRF